MAKKSVAPRSQAKKGKATRKRPASRTKKPVSAALAVAAPPKTGSVTRRFVVLAVTMIMTIGAGMLIRSGQAATFQGPSQAPPGGNIPVTIWNGVATGTQQTSASINIDGGGPAGTNPVGLSVGSNAADLGVAASGQNVIYGVGDPAKMHAQDYLFLLQAPAGTDRFSIDDAGNVGIGTTGPANNKLQVAGLINFNNTTTGTFLGYQAGNVTTGTENTFVGYQAGLANTAGTRNTAFGKSALLANTTGTFNTAFGYGALSAATTASRNVALGYRTLLSNTASDNIGVGFQALFANTSGNFNVAVGSNPLGANTIGFGNTAVGHEALMASVTANSGTAMGTSALRSSTGSGNTAIGYQAGFTGTAITTGTFNTFLGYNAQSSSATLTNATAIGANAVVGQSDAVVLGNNAKVGIGSPTPGYKLDVRETAGAGNTAIVSINQDNAAKLYTGLRLARLANAERWFLGMNDVDDKWRLRSTPNDVLVVDAAGNATLSAGAASGSLSTFSADANQFAGTVEATKMCLGNAVTGNEAFCRTVWPMGVDSYDPTICFGPVYVGESNVSSSGNVGATSVSGYRRANEICAATPGIGAGGHVCSVDEMLMSIKCAAPLLLAEANDQFFWLNGGPPGYTANAKDCAAWTDGSGTAFGRIWQTNSNTGGVGSLTTCSATLPFACCK